MRIVAGGGVGRDQEEADEWARAQREMTTMEQGDPWWLAGALAFLVIGQN